VTYWLRVSAHVTNCKGCFLFVWLLRKPWACHSINRSIVHIKLSQTQLRSARLVKYNLDQSTLALETEHIMPLSLEFVRGTSWEVLSNNVPSNFLKSVCAQNFLCATFKSTHLYLERHVWNMCKNIILKENSCALQVFLCALIWQPVFMHAHTHSLEGTLPSSPAMCWPFIVLDPEIYPLMSRGPMSRKWGPLGTPREPLIFVLCLHYGDLYYIICHCVFSLTCIFCLFFRASILAPSLSVDIFRQQLSSRFLWLLSVNGATDLRSVPSLWPLMG